MIAAALSTACGGAAAGAGAGGAAGAAGASGAAGVAGTAGTPGAAGAAECPSGWGDVEVAIDAADVTVARGQPCASMSASVDWQTTGIVTTSTADTLTIDACPPDAFCLPKLSTVQVFAADLALAIPQGSIVLAHYRADNVSWFCITSVVIESVGDWGGRHDAMGDGHLYLAAMDGDDAAPDGVAFGVARTKPSCGVVQGDLGDADGYGLRFSSAGQPDVTVYMGETRPLVVGEQTLRARDLRSYELHQTDKFWDWAYWVAP